MPTRVWRRFEAARGSLKLRVEELAAERYDEAVAMLLKHFTADEPPCKHIEVHKHPAALAALERLWRGALAQGVSVACVVDDDAEAPELVGVNVLAVAGREDKDEVFQSDDPVWAALYGAVDLVSRSVDICQHFAVQRYLTAFGLVVAPQYRGMAVGKEILLARIPLCKALDIKVTATVFTAAASQSVAAKAGFITLFEISYEELAKRGFVFPGVEKSTRYSKLMALVIE
ncbi:uncharacterized protein LOC125488466 [Plutella xylostella]|uniref:uncharacterized protein LOC125488466 n=1 Tax=Plutella xylostella TaxID=51655 RepID=UPI002033177E|nr:uncharacterized protein LOC125488466 [Plutella xylostella]